MYVHVIQELPSCNWFCSAECKRIFYNLKFLVSLPPSNVKDFYMKIVPKKLKDNDAGSISNLEVNWIVYSGKDACKEKNLLVTQVVEMFHVSIV